MTRAQPGQPGADQELARRAKAYRLSARSPSTERAYGFDLADFEAWCRDRRLRPYPAKPTQVGLYLTALSGKRATATLRRRLAAISVAHRVRGLHLDVRHPDIADVFAGIRRAYGSRQTPKRAILTTDLKAMIGHLPETLAGIRNRAILLIGFAAALRRSELVGLDVADLNITASGVVLTIVHSKTDQEGAGVETGIPRGRPASCPVAALERWLAASGITEGAVFRMVHKGGRRLGDRLAGDSIAEIVKGAAAAAGFEARHYGAHSLRSGFCTSASEQGVDLAPIMRQARMSSVATGRRYVQQGELLRNRASKAVGL